MPKKNNHVQFASLFKSTQVICQTQKTNRDDILLDILHLLAYERGIGNVNDAYQAVLAREKEMPTIVGPGIAMPHARLDAIDSIVVGVATCQNGIVYDPLNPDKLIKLIILTLAPKAAPGAYLQTVSSIAKVCQDPSTADTVAGFATADKVWEFFHRDSLELPDHLRACDIMEPVTIKMQEQDTLEHAIDLFVRHRLNELPVVDKDNELIGVVSTYELLRVCLPDYVLWMEDLTPILNFEPFSQILQKESKTWLTEIMTTEYATVDENSPAIQVAKEITRQHADLAYVVRGKQLVGIVTLANFLNKILRE